MVNTDRLSIATKMEMLGILKATCAYLELSDSDGFPAECPKESLLTINKMVNFVLSDGKSELPEFGIVQFAPTGPLQEIAMANGWHDEYMVLSERYDALEHYWDRFQSENV